MKRVIQFAALIVSHLAIFTLANRTVMVLSLFAGFVSTDQEPLIWLAGRNAKVKLDGRPGFPPFEQELEGLGALLGRPAPEIFRLVLQLKDNDLISAGTTCDSLHWPQCDPVTLGKMRTVLGR